MRQEEYTQEEKQELLRVARTTLELYLKDRTIYQPQTNNEKFLKERGVFVTLHKSGELRGCIGNIKPVKPLIEGVRDNALAAAFDDPRFLPLTKEELSEIDIEISILTKPQPATLEQIRPGKDGVVLENGGLTATFLPQVWEDLPEKKDFLSHLCQKAGLDVNSWQDPETKFECYQAVVFGEK